MVVLLCYGYHVIRTPYLPLHLNSNFMFVLCFMGVSKFGEDLHTIVDLLF